MPNHVCHGPLAPVVIDRFHSLCQTRSLPYLTVSGDARGRCWSLLHQNLSQVSQGPTTDREYYTNPSNSEIVEI